MSIKISHIISSMFIKHLKEYFKPYINTIDIKIREEYDSDPINYSFNTYYKIIINYCYIFYIYTDISVISLLYSESSKDSYHIVYTYNFISRPHVSIISEAKETIELEMVEELDKNSIIKSIKRELKINKIKKIIN